MSATTPRRRRLRRLGALAFVLGAYPAFVLGTVYAHWLGADLPGGRDGPADAYRHALASAIRWPARLPLSTVDTYCGSSVSSPRKSYQL